MTRTLAEPDRVTAAPTGDRTVTELAASRSRIVARADESRRRLQHDLHRGAQQRLTHTIIALRLASGALAAGYPAADLINEALAHAERASRELADAVRGTLPSILVHGGLRSGVESVVTDLALAAEVWVRVPRLPPATEITAYLVIAEALTNVARHACADRVGVCVQLHGDLLLLQVRDNGVGGADPIRGGGLTGLIDRVDAAGGTMTITSPAGAGTVLSAALPVDVAQPEM